MIGLRWTLRLCLLVFAIEAGTGPVISPASEAGPKPHATAALPEVRLRKLHLVRPDLIPYPIIYEVIC